MSENCTGFSTAFTVQLDPDVRARALNQFFMDLKQANKHAMKHPREQEPRAGTQPGRAADGPRRSVKLRVTETKEHVAQAQPEQRADRVRVDSRQRNSSDVRRAEEVRCSVPESTRPPRESSRPSRQTGAYSHRGLLDDSALKQEIERQVRATRTQAERTRDTMIENLENIVNEQARQMREMKRDLKRTLEDIYFLVKEDGRLREECSELRAELARTNEYIRFSPAKPSYRRRDDPNGKNFYKWVKKEASAAHIPPPIDTQSAASSKPTSLPSLILSESPVKLASQNEGSSIVAERVGKRQGEKRRAGDDEHTRAVIRKLETHLIQTRSKRALSVSSPSGDPDVRQPPTKRQRDQTDKRGPGDGYDEEDDGIYVPAHGDWDDSDEEEFPLSAHTVMNSPYHREPPPKEVARRQKR
ncbi:hypothetical protein DFH11DRAFT_1620552 [Phellopilus nigrolimitatus]|nr:hypothetical protein DFH11DRAFT_1620552 [Phellopilus nigrolimitatus]